MRHALMLVALVLLVAQGGLAGQRLEEGRSNWPVYTSAVYIVNASVGATIPVKNDLRQEPFGLRTGRTASEDFFLGTGTALSPGLPFLVTQMVSTVLATGTGQSRRYGLIGLAIHGISFTVGALAEPITYARLAAPREKPLQTVVAIGNVVWSMLMTVLAIRELR